MPLVKQRGLLLIGNFSFQVNSKVQHDMWFNNAPWGPPDSWPDSFLEIAQKAGAKTVAFLSADQEFAQNLVVIAREVAKKRNMPIVFDQAYPPNTVEFSSIIRALKAASPTWFMFRRTRRIRPASCAPSTRSGSATTSRFSAAAWSACNSAR